MIIFYFFTFSLQIKYYFSLDVSIFQAFCLLGFIKIFQVLSLYADNVAEKNGYIKSVLCATNNTSVTSNINKF